MAGPPVTVSVNGRPLPEADWSYRPAEHLVTLRSLPPGTVLLRFGGAAGELSARQDQPVPVAARPASPMTIVFPRTFAESPIGRRLQDG